MKNLYEEKIEYFTKKLKSKNEEINDIEEYHNKIIKKIETSHEKFKELTE